MTAFRNARRALAVLLVAGIAACGGSPSAEPGPKPPIGLFTTLPIYWNEAAGVEEMLAEPGEAPWTRTAIERHFDPVPLDTLTDGAGLEKLRLLLMAQPRALSAEENVALDEWVRAGGRVLLFADPMLTAHSRFAFGDRRRPQDVVLISPILSRWGLELEYLEEQAEGERTVAAGDVELPVNLPGRLRPTQGFDSRCQIEAQGLIARCTIGAGQAVVIADAALLEDEHGEEASRAPAFERLLANLAATAAAPAGDDAGQGESRRGRAGDGAGNRDVEPRSEGERPGDGGRETT